MAHHAAHPVLVEPSFSLCVDFVRPPLSPRCKARRVASMGHLGPWPLPRSLGSYYLSQGSGTGVQFSSRIPRVLPARKKFGPSPGKILATPLCKARVPRTAILGIGRPFKLLPATLNAFRLITEHWLETRDYPTHCRGNRNTHYPCEPQTFISIC